MARQIAAVYGRNILRIKRRERRRVIPIKKMPLKFFELTQRGKAQFKPLDGFEQAYVTEIARRASRKQQQSHIGRRGAMRDDGTRVFLKIIGRQPMVCISDESFKESPGAPRDQPQRLPVWLIQYAAGFFQRRSAAADEISQPRRQRPRQ